MSHTLESIAAAYNAHAAQCAHRIVVCAGTGCVANGALKVVDQLRQAVADVGLTAHVRIDIETEGHGGDPAHHVRLTGSGCQGFCQMGPLVTVEPEGILYVRVKPEDAGEIVSTTLVKGERVERLLYRDPVSEEACRGTAEIPFYKRQQRRVLAACGHLDPEDVDAYIAGGGYFAARKAYLEMRPEEVCDVVSQSGLRGRGGGGFPTGRKWQAALVQKATPKYVVCNGDEGDPGAFMDRSVMEGNPHAVIEGMMLAARAIGATEGYVYVRLEYPLAVARVRKAVKDATARGILGDNVFGTHHKLRIQVMEGAGAFVCGEETALLASIEGHRGMPQPKPPFPAEKGLWGKPTIINNVETLATVPLIMNEGPAAFRAIGTAGSPGTKTFALTGHVANSGLIEVPFGTTLREIVYNIGGGVTDDRGQRLENAFKAVQIGGPSGGCLTQDHLDVSLDFDSLRQVGAMVGSGGLVVMNQHTCMVKIARYFMQFTQNESCGKCVLCREGTCQMLGLLDDIIEGNATAETLELLEELAITVAKGSLCGLGKTAPSPVLSTLRHFRAEYEAHVFHKCCPARQCKSLLKPAIDLDKCKGCGLCARKCPVNAITGPKRGPYVIDGNVCIKCGVCAELCRFDAVVGM